MNGLRGAASILAALLAGGTSSAQVNRGLSFGGGELVQVPASPSLNALTSTITLEAWVRLQSAGSYPTVLRRNEAPGVSSEPAYILRVENFIGGQVTLSFYLRIGPSEFGTFGTYGLQEAVPPSFGEWHHFAGTYDGATMRLYWDGVFLDDLHYPGGTAGIAPATVPLTIGSGGLGDDWPGEIDEVRIWNYARSASQLAGFRHSPLLGTEPGLVAYWRLDEGTGQFVADATANGNTGQLGSLATVDPLDPSWFEPAAPLGPVVSSVSPGFGPFYGSTPVTISGTGFAPGGNALSIGGQPVAGAVVTGPGTITAVVPPGPVGPADVSVSSLYGAGIGDDGWTWADHLHATGGISAASGGTVGLALFAEPWNGLRFYVLATSLSGTSPGVPLPGSPLVLPLNPDVWTTIGLQQVNSPTFSGFFGILTAQGAATASFNLGPIPLSPSPVGLPISFAYATFLPLTGAFTLASNPVTVVVSP